jgi:hypothetical protein
MKSEITFRMDSGYFDEDIIKVIEEVNCKYVINYCIYFLNFIKKNLQT